MNEFEKNIIEIGRQLDTADIQFSHAEALSGQTPDCVIVYGMGGSGLAGRILQGAAVEIKLSVPVLTWSDYGVPPHSFKNPLYVFVSFSGNTAETLSGFQTVPAGALRAAITTGGNLKAMAEAARVPLAVFSAGTMPPRLATAYSFYALLGLLSRSFSGLNIQSLRGQFQGDRNRAAGKTLAEKLAKKIILVYATSRNSYLGYAWKTGLNETSKALAFANVIPEICHNEIVSFETKPANLIALFLNDPADHPENKKRIVFIDQLLAARNIPSVHVTLEGTGIFEKIFQSLNLAEWTSFYLAEAHGVDPIDIRIINELKRLMA